MADTITVEERWIKAGGLVMCRTRVNGGVWFDQVWTERNAPVAILSDAGRMNGEWPIEQRITTVNK